METNFSLEVDSMLKCYSFEQINKVLPFKFGGNMEVYPFILTDCRSIGTTKQNLIGNPQQFRVQYSSQGIGDNAVTSSIRIA